jgi:hypothetical protein
MLSSSADLAVEVRSQPAGALQACEKWTLTLLSLIGDDLFPVRVRKFPVPLPLIPCSEIGEFIAKDL